MIDYQLDGRSALICGASRGMGQAVARCFAASKASVCLLARNEDALQALLAELPQLGHKPHHYIVCDMADAKSVRQSAALALEKMGSFSILINNSGGPPPGPAHTAQISEFSTAIEQHLFSAQILSQALLPGMKTLGSGRIVNIISTSVKQPLPNLGVSNTVRAAVASWAKTMATELGPLGITVNNLLPGAVATQRLQQVLLAKAQKTNRDISEIEADAKEEIPLRRFADPDEIAQVVAFLCSKGGGYINGTNIVVDGGRLGSL